MRATSLLLAIALVAIAGCSKPDAAPPAVTPVTHDPVDWYDGDEHPPTPPLTDNACTTSPGGSLEIRNEDGDWRPHPLAAGKLYVPSAVAVICNASASPMAAHRITITDAMPNVSLPALDPGQAVGPLRLFADKGLPASQLDYLPAGTPRPEEPSTADLERLAWAHAGDFSLYAPDATYTVQTAPWCGAPTGAINASAYHWRLYRRGRGLVLEVGPRKFPGGRGMEAVAVPTLGTTFLFLADYASCANPTWYAVYAFDEATGTAYRPQMKRADGTVNAATVVQYSITPEGTLTSKSYSNAGDVGWHTYTYKWDAPSRTWEYAAP